MAPPLPIKPTGDKILVFVRVTPNARTNAIEHIQELSPGETVLRIKTTAQPEKGKANQSVIKMLAKAWGLPKSAFSVKTGTTDRNKVIEIEADNPAELIARLETDLRARRPAS